ncbi:MFS quinate transporter-like protein QutD [Aureobasidium pullulans]|uniref:Quinate transporter n=1 Tax=Aureobasidium pullulans TaxID=5580 RepID=A0A4S9L2N4_AURPU|nr:MFS quinate transporter-like protein QutD [Aureobasidium pullulans]
MGVLAKIEDRPTPPCVYNWRVYLSAVVAAFSSCMIGYTTSFIGTTVALDSFQEYYGLDKLSDSKSSFISANIVSLFQAGAFFGSIFAYTTSYFLGRRASIWIFITIFLVGAGITLSPSHTLGPLYAGRVISGFGVGGCTMVVPIFLSEIAPPAIRGRLVGLYELGWQTGGLVGFWIIFGVSESSPLTGRDQFLVPFAIQLVPAGMVLIGSVMLRETPRWLFSKGRREQAIKNLCWIRNLEPTDQYIIEEVEMMEAANDEIPKGFFQPIKLALTDRKILWRLFLGHMLFVLQNFSGINAINYYSPTIFRTMGINSNYTVDLMTGIFGVLKTVMTVLWLTVLVDKWGRRQLLVYGSIAGASCMYIIGALITAKVGQGNQDTSHLSSQGIATIVMVYLWTTFYIPSWNGTPWVINSEMFSTASRNVGQVSASMANWLWTFIIARFTPDMISGMGPDGCGMYFFFAGMSTLSLLFVWYLLPETKSVPLDKMNRLFEIQPPRKAQPILMQELQDENLEMSVANGKRMSQSSEHRA